MRLAHIKEHKNGLLNRSCLQLSINPGELIGQAPGVASEVEPLKWLSQHSPRGRTGVKPVDCTSTDRAITSPTEALDHIGPLQLKAIGFNSCTASKGHTEQLACLRIDQRLIGIDNTWGEPHPERGMAAVGEMTGCLGPMQRANARQMGNGSGGMGRSEGVVATGIKADEQHRVGQALCLLHDRNVERGN